MRGGRRTPAHRGRAVEPQGREAERERLAQRHGGDLERAVAEVRRVDPVQGGDAALAPQVHRDGLAAQIDAAPIDDDLAGGIGVVDDRARVGRRGQPGGELRMRLATAAPRDVPRERVDRADRGGLGEPAVERADQIFSVVDDLRVERREPLGRPARRVGVGIEPRAPHGGSRAPRARDEHGLADPQGAAPALVEDDCEPDLEPRALAAPHGAVEVLAHDFATLPEPTPENPWASPAATLLSTGMRGRGSYRSACKLEDPCHWIPERE